MELLVFLQIRTYFERLHTTAIGRSLHGLGFTWRAGVVLDTTTDGDKDHLRKVGISEGQFLAASLGEAVLNSHGARKDLSAGESGDSGAEGSGGDDDFLGERHYDCLNQEVIESRK